MMMFDQNLQIATKRNIHYGAKQSDEFWANRAFLGPKTLFEVKS